PSFVTEPCSRGVPARPVAPIRRRMGVREESGCEGEMARVRTFDVSAAEARRIALAAQGFADRPPTGAVDGRLIRRVLGRIGLLQVDSVNVLVRTQYLPLYARLGPYSAPILDAMT